MNHNLTRWLQKTPTGERLIQDRRFRLILFAVANMGVNLLYALFCAVVALVSRSYWFLAMAAYYAVLGLLKLGAVFSQRQGRSPRRSLLVTGLGLLCLSCILAGIISLSISDAVGRAYHLYVMLAIAAFTFFTFIKAVVNAIRARKSRDISLILLRNISLSAAAGSILSLQRSMLSTFGDKSGHFALVMEASVGMAAFLLVVFLAFSMIRACLKTRP